MKNLSILFAALLLIFASCKNEGTSLKEDALTNIPKDVSAITAINVNQLMEKADFEAVKQMEFYQKMIQETKDKSPALAEVMKNPAQSGVDLDKNLYFTYDLNPKNPEEVFVATVFSLKDKAAFVKLLKEANDIEIVSKEGYDMTTSFSQQVVAWNNEIGVFGGSNIYGVSLEEQVEKIFNTEAEQSVAGNENLQKALSGSHDIASWMSTNPIAENPQAGMVLSLMEIKSEALKDNFIHSALDFENGKIVGRSDFFVQKDLGEDFIGRFFKDKIDTDFTPYMPGDQLLSVTTAAIDIRGIDQFLSERPQTRSYVDFMLSDVGLSMKDLIETFGGDIMVAGYGDTEKMNGKDAFGLMATNIKSQEKLQEFLDLAEEKKILVELEEDYYKLTTLRAPGTFSLSRGKGFGKILIKDDLLFMSDNEALLEQIKTGDFKKAEMINRSLKQMLHQNTLASYFDFGVLKGMIPDIEGADFKDLKFNINGEGADFQLDMEQSGVNSLNAIFKMLNEQYIKQENKPDM